MFWWVPPCCQFLGLFFKLFLYTLHLYFIWYWLCYQSQIFQIHHTLLELIFFVHLFFILFTSHQCSWASIAQGTFLSCWWLFLVVLFYDFYAIHYSRYRKSHYFQCIWVQCKLNLGLIQYDTPPSYTLDI